MNPRPRKPAMKSLRAYPAQKISAIRFRTGERGGGLARLDLDRRLRTEALGLSRKMTLTHRRAGSAAGAAT